MLEELQDFNINERRVAIIADSNTAALYGEEIKKLLEGNCKKVILHSFPAGEENKTLDTVKDIYKTLIEEKYDRKDLLLALGGGVVMDVAGDVDIKDQTPVRIIVPVGMFI